MQSYVKVISSTVKINHKNSESIVKASIDLLD